MEEVAKNNSSLADCTSPLCHSVDPWGASVRGQKEVSPAKDQGWGWQLACLQFIKIRSVERHTDKTAHAVLLCKSNHINQTVNM